MATSLQKQLAAIAASSTHQLDLKAQKAAHGKSLLFDAKTAASQSFDSLYQLCYEGYRDLCALDARFTHFSKSLFSEQSKAEDRTQMTADENARLDAVLEAFITLVGPRLLLKPAQKALEWLVRRFRVHEYNTERLAFAFLPYHHTPQFLALLSILPGLPPPALRFLHPYIKTPTAVPRRTIVYTAINTPAFLDALHAHTVKVVQAGHQAAPMLSFWASISVEAIFGILEDNSSGMRNMQDHSTERLVLRVLPALNSCMQARHGAETVEACYLIVTVLAGRADLGDKVLDGLMEAVILAHGPESLDACLACLAVIAEQRSDAQIARKVLKRLLAIPDLSARLLAVSKQCRVQRLTLGCVLGALAGFGRSDEHHALFLQLMASGLLSEAHTRSALSTLISFICDSTPVSGEHGQALEAAAKLAETPSFLDVMRVAAKAKDLDLGSLGLTIGQTLEPVQLDDDSDEEMLDVDDEPIDAPDIPVPSFTAKSFLHLTASEDFAQVATAFEQAVSAKKTKQFLASQTLQRESALQQTVYLSFLARVWSSPRSNLARGAALRAALAVVKQADATQNLQHLTPYLVHALTDPWRPIRRAAADCIAALSEKTGANSKSLVWGSSDLYGQGSTTVTELKADDVSSLLSSMLVPILEESVMDMTFAVPAIRELLDGSHTSKTQTSRALKSHARTAIISFLASHTHLTPLLRVRVSLLPVFDFLGKISDPIRNATILPLIRTWSALRSAQAAALCNSETIDCEEAERAHLSVLRAKETSSVQLLCDIVSGDLSNDRIQLADAAFDRIRIFWPKIKPNAKSSLAQTLLKLSFGEGSQEFEKHCREQALDTLRDVTLDSDTLVAFVGSVPSAVQMPEGPPVKKRRRTSRNEMARVELSSQDDVQRLLRKLTLVLELVEGSNPGEHPTLFRSLFNVFGELQQLKQQSGSELVYLQSMILGALSPIVDTLKRQQNTAEYQSAVQADLLIECIRHSTSPQVQNSALLLIANLASWVPDLILQHLMPIFTFIGSTLLRQQDDYSAAIVDKVISRVVPQLAASLRAKHRNLLTGVADLLLSFTAAFDHMPLHRKLKLFSELARTLGPEDSLSAILALLAEKFHNGKTQRRFSTDLLLVFEPINTLHAFKGYLDLVIDIAGPKRKISDTLFVLNEKSPIEIDIALKDLLATLAELADDERVRAHVTRAFRRKDESAKPREIFANIIEAIIQLSKKVATSPKLYDACSRVLARCLDLLPTTDLIKSTELLLSNLDVHVQVAAIKSVEVRAGKTVQNDRKAVEALISFLPSIETVLQQSGELDVKIIAVSCIDRIIERFGKKDVSAVSSVAQTIAGPQSLSSDDDRIRVLSLLCLTSIVDVLEDEAIPLLPTVLPTAFEYLSQAIEEEKTGLHNAVYTLLSNIVERLGNMFSRQYLDTALQISHRSAEAALEDSCDESRRSFSQSVSEQLGAQEIFAVVKSTWPHAVSQGFEASIEHLDLLRSTVDTQTKAKLIKASSTLFSLLLQLFKLRDAVEAQGKSGFDEDEMEEMDNKLVETVLDMVLKLNDATFRPFFVQLVEQEGPARTKPEHAITFYKFLAAFFEKFKSIVTGYSSYIIEDAAQLLTQLAKEDADSALRNAVLGAMQKTFQHDQDAFWQAPSHYGTILAPLVNLLTLPSAEQHVIPAITDLAASSSSSLDNFRELNTMLLRFMRSDSAATRLATVKCEQSLTQRLGEEWLALLPEMLPFISELREDDDEMVERETQRWIGQVEEVLGESLEGMLQ